MIENILPYPWYSWSGTKKELPKTLFIRCSWQHFNIILKGTELTIEWMNQLQIQMDREKVDLVVEMPDLAVGVLSSSGRCVEPSHCSLCCRPEIRRVEVTQVMQHWHPRTDSSSQLCSDPPMVNTLPVWALLWGISWGGTLDRYKALLSGQWRVVRTSSSGIVIGVTGINVPGVTEWSLVSHCLKSEWSLWYLGELPPWVELYFEPARHTSWCRSMDGGMLSKSQTFCLPPS